MKKELSLRDKLELIRCFIAFKPTKPILATEPLFSQSNNTEKDKKKKRITKKDYSRVSLEDL